MAALTLPDVVSDDLYMAALEVIEAYTALENANASEPDVTGSMARDHEPWTRWNDETYGPAVDRWEATTEALAALLPARPVDSRRAAHAVMDAWRARHKTLTATLCESCRARESSTVVVVAGEPFRVCGGCLLPETGAVA